MNETGIIGYSAGVFSQGRWWACYCILAPDGKVIRKMFRPLDMEIVKDLEQANHEAYFDALAGKAALGLHRSEVYNEAKVWASENRAATLPRSLQRLIAKAKAELKKVPKLESENTKEM